MVEFGELIVVDGFKIPWLIWIQLLVMLLLFLLLLSLSFFPSSSSSSSSSSSFDAEPSTSSSADLICVDASPSRGPLDSTTLSHSSIRLVHSCSSAATSVRHNQVGESQSIRGVIPRNTSKMVVREEDEVEREGYGHIDLHPCNIVRLARIAFLKCLGIDSRSDHSPGKEHKRSSSKEHKQ